MNKIVKVIITCALGSDTTLVNECTSATVATDLHYLMLQIILLKLVIFHF